MLNYSLDVSTSSLIAICTLSCLYKLCVQVDHDPTITSCLYERESVTYRLAHLHLNRKSSDDTNALQVYTTLSWDALMKTKCSHAMFSWEQVRMRCSHENKMFACDVLMRTSCSHASDCSKHSHQMFADVRGPLQRTSYSARAASAFSTLYKCFFFFINALPFQLSRKSTNHLSSTIPFRRVRHFFSFFSFHHFCQRFFGLTYFVPLVCSNKRIFLRLSI